MLPNFLAALLFQEDTLTVLSPAQVAQLTLISGALNDAGLIGLVFERLEGDGNALQNVDQFFTELTSEETVGCSSMPKTDH